MIQSMANFLQVRAMTNFYHKTAETGLQKQGWYLAIFISNLLINQTGKLLSEFLLFKCLVALKHSLGSSLCGKEQYFQV